MKQIEMECTECDSTVVLEYEEDAVSDDYPLYCPFCGERTDSFSEYIEDDESTEEDL